MPVRRVDLGPVGRMVKNNIRSRRLGLEFTQAELATRAGVPNQAITEIENGARRVNVDDLVLIAKALNVAPEELLR